MSARSWYLKYNIKHLVEDVLDPGSVNAPIEEIKHHTSSALRIKRMRWAADVLLNDNPVISLQAVCRNENFMTIRRRVCACGKATCWDNSTRCCWKDSYRKTGLTLRNHEMEEDEDKTRRKGWRKGGEDREACRENALCFSHDASDDLCSHGVFLCSRLHDSPFLPSAGC